MRSLHLGSAVLFVLAGFAAPAMAQDCNNPAIDQATMNQCAYNDWQAADAALNAVWKRAMSAAREMDAYTSAGEVPMAVVLRDAQRAWIGFRDKACDAESMIMRGGSAQPLLRYGCLARLTRARVDDLEIIADLN